MKGFFSLLVVVLSFVVVQLVCGADANPVTITKVFNKESVGQVLRYVESQAQLKIVYNPSEVDSKRLVTRSFKEASPIAVIRAVVGKDFTLSKKGNVITIRPRPVEPSSGGVVSGSSSGVEKKKTDSVSGVKSVPVGVQRREVVESSSRVSKLPTITKSFSNTPLRKVFAFVEKQTDLTIMYDSTLNDKQRVRFDFKDADPLFVVRTVVGSDYTVKKKGSDVTIKVKSGRALKKVEESVGVVERKGEEKLKKEKLVMDSFSHVGHYGQMMLGMGYGSVNPRLGDNPQTGESPGSVRGTYGSMIQIQYAYYFHENWGVTVGADFSNYMSNIRLNTRKFYEGNELIDDEGEPYTPGIEMRGWKERELINLLNIPVGIQMQYPISPKDVRLYLGMGLRVGFPITRNSRLREGSIAHIGYYENTGAILHDIDKRDFYSEYVGDANRRKDASPFDTKSVSVGVMADLGFMFPIDPKLDLMLGFYFNMTCNNMYSRGDEIGWQQTFPLDGHNGHTYMPKYSSVMESEYIKSVRPYQVGVKFGISWHKSTKIERGDKKVEVKEIVPLREDPREALHNTIPMIRVSKRKVPVLQIEDPAIARSTRLIKSLVSTFVIWFNIGSSVPNIRPADALVKIADVLKQNPRQGLLIVGHSSKDGNVDFNQQLSENRAKSIYDRFVELGVNPKQLEYKGVGISEEYKGNDAHGGAHDISLDRRAELVPKKL